MAVIVKKKDAPGVIAALKKEKIKSFEIGEITRGLSKTSKPKVEFI
jgi:phosphoribosylaminoimidazole (AIR) synthetase